jgi:transposase-like protein
MSKVITLKPSVPVPAKRSASDWQDLVEAYQRSGESRRAFCARHGLSVNTLAWWQWRRRREKIPARRSRPTNNLPLFVEVESAPTASETASSPMPWDIELELGGGMTLRLRRQPC